MQQDSEKTMPQQSVWNLYRRTERKVQQLFFTRREQQYFLEDVSQLIGDGVPVHDAVETIGEVSSTQTKEVALSISHHLSQGGYFADGLKGWFPRPIIEVIRAGEQGGTLAENMKAAAQALSQRVSAISSILSATLYPLAVLVLGMMVSVWIKNSVFDNFALIKPVNLWPENGRILYSVTTFIEHFWWAMLIVVAASVVLFTKLLKELTGPIRQSLDTLPIFTLYRDVNAARYMETLGLLLINGIVLKKALSIMQQDAGSYMGWHNLQMQYRLSEGYENIADVLDTGMIKKSNMLRLRVIAKGKGFEHALVRMGQLSAKQNARILATAAKIFGGVMLFAGAAWLIFMIISMYGVGSFVGT